ncbi:IPT/TIG domain-containing protein [uncultured Microscilla sp.]|uniref:IPT/TIG domain-containing protein n=1 Tax=uncultured Microscilla sp. TaxID=432653 RepID=UPI0026201276|nr:IPT/TIG domain-containing protein [uncultured Microscilla sp.]
MRKILSTKYLLTLLVLTTCFYSVNAQEERDLREDRAKERVEYERAMLVDPKTGKIPDRIYQKSIEFIYSPKSKLQPQHQKFTTSITGISGAKWAQRGPHNVGGRTRALAIDQANEQVILAGGASGGMWRSDNGGASWSKVTGASQNHSVTAIAQDPQNPATWYYTAGEGAGNSASASFSAPFVGNGVYKSTDNGLTWVLLTNTASGANEGDNPFRITWNVKVHPTNGDVYVANARRYSNGQSGIWRSTDGGANWNLVLDGDGAGYTDIAITADGVFYATIASSGGTNKGIYRSTDGTNWVSINPGFLPGSYARIVLDVAPSNNNVVYFFAAAGTTANGHSFYKYTYTAGEGNGDGSLKNGGVWEDRSAQLPTGDGSTDGGLLQENYNQYVKVKPDNENIVFIGSTNLYRSTDGFATTGNTAWIGGYHKTNFFYPEHHPDNHSLVFFPSDAKKMISGHDGGVSITTDNLATGGDHPVVWTYLNNGYYTTQIYGMDIDAKTAGDPRLSAGFQDNGKWTTHSFSGTSPWKQENFFGDGGYTAIVPGKDIRFFSNQNGHMFRVTGNDPENPTSAVYLRPQSFGSFLFVTPYVLDPNNSNIMYYLVGPTVYRNTNILYTNSINNWENLATASAGGAITAINVSEENPRHRIYYGTNNGKVFRMDNADSGDPIQVDIWTGKGLPADAYVSNVAVDPTNGDNVFVVFSNYGVQSVYYSTDAGDTWTAVSGNLEENPDGTGNGPSTRWLTVHVKADGSKIYLLGTSVGLYATNALNGMNTQWVQEGASTIGNVPVVMIKSRRSDGLVALGTHGTGLFSGYIGASTDLTIANVSPQRGEVGTEVIINGTNFSATAADNVVKFNGTIATVTTATVNNLTVTVPTGATTGKITVEVNAKTATSANDFTVVPVISTYPHSESFENGVSDWIQPTTDGFDWSLVNKSTPTDQTGPAKAFSGDFFLYTEIDQFSHDTFDEQPLNKNKTALFTSPTFDLTSLTNPEVLFAYHMFGDKMGTLSLEASTDGANWQSVWTKTGSQSDAWAIAVVDVTTHKSATTKFRFVGATGGGSTSDMAIDGVIVTEAGTPLIFDFAPQTVIGGFSSVNILGANFDATAANNEVKFNGVAGIVTAATATTLKVKVPLNATTGKISITVNGKTVTSAKDLNVIAPITTFPYAESFEAGLGKWIQAEDDDMEWLRKNGKTPSDNTGPTAAADGSFYVYTEATGNFNKKAILTSALFNAKTVDDPLFSFKYHMYGGNMGSLSLEISSDGENWTTLWTKSGDQGDTWISDGVSLESYKNTPFALRFVGITGGGFMSDISIDHLQLLSGPGITSFTPASGKVGDVVTITGKNFSAVKDENVVEFNGIKAIVTSSTATQIVTTVPNTATTGKIRIVVNGLPTISKDDFTVVASGLVPTITSISPMAGVIGQSISIEGTNFSVPKDNNQVYFNGLVATIESATATKLMVKVPTNATSGKIKVVNAGGQSVESASDFIVYCASKAASTDDSRIDNFTLNEINHTTDGAGVCSDYSDFTNISTHVITGTTYPFSVKAGSCNGDYTKFVKVYVDWNQDGDFSDANEFLGGNAVAIREPGVFESTVTVPTNALLGRTRLRVVLGEVASADQVQACGPYNFGETEDYSIVILEKPEITSFDPARGKVGQQVSINGKNFPDKSAYVNVKFARGVAATIASVNSTQIKVTVPEGAITGPITVTVAGQSVTSAFDFTVIPDTPIAPDKLALKLVNGMVHLTWSDNSDNETAFYIERSAPDALDKFVKVGEVSAGITEYSEDVKNLSSKHHYRVAAVNSAGTSAYSNVVTFDAEVLSVQSVLLAQRLKITPNPNHGKFNIEIGQAQQATIKLEVIDAKGRLVKVLNLAGQQGKYPVNLSELRQGVYTLRISTGKANAAIKYMKQ